MQSEDDKARRNVDKQLAKVEAIMVTELAALEKRGHDGEKVLLAGTRAQIGVDDVVEPPPEGGSKQGQLLYLLLLRSYCVLVGVPVLRPALRVDGDKD